LEDYICLMDEQLKARAEVKDKPLE
ncbi:DNA-binding transcriptional regulator, partial [Morganella morganii]|nr:DNA-binding transcriptional regulator [Morganella morganii]